ALAPKAAAPAPTAAATGNQPGDRSASGAAPAVPARGNTEPAVSPSMPGSALGQDRASTEREAPSLGVSGSTLRSWEIASAALAAALLVSSLVIGFLARNAR